MTKDRPAVEIKIEHSSVGGDVVAGDKTTVHVHLHQDQLTSNEAIYKALVRQGHEPAAGDLLIQAMLSDPKLEERFEAARLARDRNQVDELIDATIRDHQRTGASPDMIANLWAAIRKAKKAEDWLSFSKSGTMLLTLMQNRPNAGAEVMQLADDLVDVGRKDKQFARNIAVGRIFQAAYLYQRHFEAVLDLRTALSASARMTVKVPVAPFLSELKSALEYSALSDLYAKQALDVAFECGDTSVGIYVLFAFVTLQNQHYFLYHGMLGEDGHELGERILRTTRILEKLIEKFGTKSDLAIMYSNTAAFWLQTGEYEKAESLANLAAKQLAALGDANAASRALSVAESARNREPALRPPPTEADIANAPIEDFVGAMRSAVAVMSKLHGIDMTDPKIRDAVESAITDFPPDRVLRYCQHINVDCAPSALGLTLAVPSLGLKTIACEKFKKRVQGTDLDRTFSAFKQSLGCEQCEHRSPRPADWKWSMGWAVREAERRYRGGDPPSGEGYF